MNYKIHQSIIVGNNSKHKMSFPFEISTLKGRQNYNEWSRKMRAYLVAEGLWNIVRTPNPSDVMKIRRTRYIIICSIDDDLLESIDADATPNAIWAAIQKRCTAQAT